jgi:myo-inositol-1(or 4)-monophosphatase
MDLDKISEKVNGLVLQVGAYIIEQRLNFDLNEVSEKGLNQLVSYVDVEAEKQLVAGLKEILPEAGFITEENTEPENNKELNWIIDPLDGTTNFIHEIPTYSISVALANVEDVLVGCVYELGRKELFYASKGQGAYLNGKRIHVSGISEMKSSLMATGFPYYDFGQMDAYFNTLKTLMKSTHGLRRIGSAAVDLAYVSCGRFEGFFEYGLHAWDVAAGILLVKEAGGQVCDFRAGSDYLYGTSIVADNSLIHNELMHIIESNFK